VEAARCVEVVDGGRDLGGGGGAGKGGQRRRRWGRVRVWPMVGLLCSPPSKIISNKFRYAHSRSMCQLAQTMAVWNVNF